MDGGTAAATFISLTPLTVVTLIALGFFGGLLSGFIGSGGAFVLTPGMMNLGVDGVVAVASNMAHKFPKALVGAWRRHKMGHVDVKLGLVMALSAIGGVQGGIVVQKIVVDTWGKAASDLYVSLAFVVILFPFGAFLLLDGLRAARSGVDEVPPPLAERIKRVKLPPMISFHQANAKVSLWVVVALGFATGLMAATIAVGGLIGVPSMIYVVGVPAFVASGTELLIAFVMGLTGAFTWALAGLVDLRLTVLLLAGSLVGVQIGAIGTSYIPPYMIKTVTGLVMLLAGISRLVSLPTYLSDLDLIPLGVAMEANLGTASLVILYATLVATGGLVIGAMIRGKRKALARSRSAQLDAGA